MTPEETLRQALLEDKFPEFESDEKPIIPIADPLKYNRMTAVSAWMGNLTGQDISPEDIGWQAEKDALAQSFFKMPDAKDVSDETVHDLIRSHIQTSDNATNIALNSALTGRPLAQTLNEIQALAGVSKTRGIRDRYVSAASSLYSDIAAKRNEYSDVINKVYGSLGEMLKKTDTDIGMTDAFNDAAERLMGVPAEDRRLVIEAIAATGNATAEERSSYLSKVEWRVNRMAETLGAASVSNLSNALESVLDLAAFGSGLADPRDVAGAAPEGNKSRELSLLAQQIRTAANEKLDPIKSNSWIGKQGLALADMATQSGVALVNPLAGFAVNLAYFNDTMGADAMTQNPGLTVEQADKITAIGAPVNAAIETITALIPFGKVKLPFVQKWLMAETASVGGVLRKFGVRAGFGTAAEIGEEIGQAYVPLKIQELMRAMGQDMPAVDWERNMPKFADIAAEVWAPALVFSIVGAGAASINDINNGRSLASDLDLLIARGIAPETAAKIKEASDLGDYNKVDSLFREEFVSETKASKPDIQAATERLKARFRDQSSIDVLQDATSPEYTAKVIRTATGWQVQTGDGNVITTETKEAADQIYSKIRQVGNQKEAEVMAEILDGFYSGGMGKGAQVEMTGETTMAQEIKAGEGRVFAERRDASGGLISQRQFGPQALETVRAEAEAAGIQTDTRGIFARINGSNEVFPQQVGDTAKGIWRILSLFESRKNATPQVATLLHEDIESKFTLGLINKSWTVGDIQKAFAALLPAFANITAPIVQTDEQIAKMSKSAQEAYYAKQSEFNWINNVRNIVDGKFDAATLRETFSEMYVRDRFALDRKGLPTGLPAGSISRGIEASIMGATTQEEAGIYKRFRAMFKAFSAHFKAVFKTVQTMVTARKEGKIGEDWDSFVNKVLGIDEVKQMESQTVDEVKAMLGVDEEVQAVIDAENMAFSISPITSAEDVAYNESIRVEPTSMMARIANRDGVGVRDNILYRKDRAYRFIGAEGLADLRETGLVRARQNTKQAYEGAVFMSGKSSGRYADTHMIELIPDNTWTGDKYITPPNNLAINDIPHRIYERNADGSYSVIEDTIGDQALLDAGNMAFSTSRAQPADTSNVTEMPDGAQLVGPTTFSIEAYHGTPYEVDRFLMSKIGTGEGNQAFGWGLYFAKARKIAEDYRRKLSAENPDAVVERVRTAWDDPIYSDTNNGWMSDNGQLLDFNSPESLALDIYSGKKSISDISEELVNDVEAILNSGDILESVAKGNLYTVELLPDEEDFLDWDKPLSEQPSIVEKLKSSNEQAVKRFISDEMQFLPRVSGKDLVFKLNVSFDDGAKAASEHLASLGIPGIRYLDGSSRAAGEGTSNYVIFDENLVKIIEKNGQKVDLGPTFSISPIAGARNAASAVNFKENPSIINPQKTKGRVKVIDLARALDQRAVDLGYKREANDYSQETIDHISDAMAEEIAYMLQRDGSGVGWYDVKINSALDLMSRVYPELNTDPEAKLRFLVMVASISQGNAVDLNFEFADRAYGEYRTSKQLPTFPYPGKSNEDITRNIAFLFEMIDKIGAEDTLKLLKDIKTVREWNKLGFEVTGEVVDAKVTGAMAIMGSKIGSFFGNLNGDFTSLTADLWFSRSWNRYTGNMESLVGDGIFDDIRQTLQPLRGKSILHGFSKADIMSDDDVAAKWVAIVAKDYAQGGFKDKTPLNVKANTAAKKLAGETNDAPRGGVERQAMRATVASAIQKVVALGFPELTMADAQAILWFNEKDLFQIYKAVNKTGAKTDYETAAQDVVKSHGLNYTVSDQFRRNDGGAIQPRVGTGEKEFNTPLGDESRANQKADNKLTFSISPAQDAEYLAAAKAGDTETAQRLAKDAEKKAGFESGWFHGSNQKIDTFSEITADDLKGFYLTASQDYAKKYGKIVHNLAVKYTNPLNLNGVWSRSFIERFARKLDERGITIPKSDIAEMFEILDEGELTATSSKTDNRFSEYQSLIYLKDAINNQINKDRQNYARERGYTDEAWSKADSLFPKNEGWKILTDIIISDGYDAIYRPESSGGIYLVEKGIDPLSLVVFDPSQIKSADPITYDDAGNIIPLSQRFNEATPDIRFSISPVRNLNELSDQVERQFAENPVGALEVKSRVIRQFAKLADKWSNERWTPQGNKIRPISEKRTVKSLDKEQAMRQAQREVELVNEGIDKLTPNTLMAYSEGVGVIQDDPLVARMLNDNGKLMSKSTAAREGRNIKDQYDDAGWIPPQWYAKAGGIMPDVMANNLGFDTASEMWAALDSSIKSHRNAKEDYAKAEAAVKAVEKAAFEQAKAEAQAWRDETDAMQKEDWSPRESLVRDLITLEAIVAMFPQEIRGKIGGFVALARKASESARLKVLQKQLERGQVLLEKHLKEQYGEATDKLLKRFKSQKDASGRITGKIISTATEQVDYAAEFIKLSIEEQADRQAALEKKVEESEDANEVQDALTKLGIARLFDMWSDKDSAARESAFNWLNDTIEAGKLGKSIMDEARKEMLTEMRQSAQSSILQGDELNPDIADNITNLNKGVFKRALLNLRGMLSEALWTTIQRLELIFGEDSKIVNHFAEKIINAANLSTDIKRLVEAQKKDALSIIFNSDSKYAHARGIAELQKMKKSGISTRRVKKEEIKLDLETLTKLNDGTMTAEAAGLRQDEVDAALEEFAANARKSTVTIERVVNAGTPVERMMSETQGIQWWLWSMQDASRKQMERDGWDADSFKQLEEFLSPEAKALGRWISGSYQDAAGMIDPIYRKLFNAPLPRTKNYSPIHRRNMNTGGDIMDIDGSDMNSGLAAGFTKARVNTTASLVEMDALAVFLAHWENVSHWVSHAELMRDMKAVLLDKDTAVAIRQKKSEGYLQRLKDDVKTIEKNGTNSANELVNISRVWRWFMQYRSYKGLAFRLSPIIKQTPALLNPLLADVPAHNYMMGMARAFIEPQTFAKEVSAMWTSDIIRRRIESGFSAESRVAMQGAGMTGSQAIVAMQAGMVPMGMVDGGWTALGAAISFDYYRRGYMRDNPQMTPEIADAKAIARVEKMIATSAQPSDIYARSLSERSGNPFMKSMSMFVSDQRKALAIELMAIRRLATGKSKNVTLDIQRAVVAHVVQAGVSQVMAVVIASLLGDDEDRDRELSSEQWALALGLGPVNGLFVFGRLIDKIGRGLLGLRVFPADDLASKVANDLLKGGKNMDDLFNPDDSDDFMDALDSASTAVGAGMSAAIGPVGGVIDVGANVAREARKIAKRLADQ